MRMRHVHHWGWILIAGLLLIGCGPRVEPEKLVRQRLSWYPDATALTETTTSEYVRVQFTTTDRYTAIRDHYRAKLPGFRFQEPVRERSVNARGDFAFLYVEGREAQVIVVDVEPAGAGQQTVTVYIYERTFRFS